MNFALLGNRVVEWAEDLVAIGVPREDAEALVKALEYGAIRAHADAKNDAQFLLDFDRLGAAVLAARRGVTQQAIRKYRTKLEKRNLRLRAGLRSGA